MTEEIDDLEYQRNLYRVYDDAFFAKHHDRLFILRPSMPLEFGDDHKRKPYQYTLVRMLDETRRLRIPVVYGTPEQPLQPTNGPEHEDSEDLAILTYSDLVEEHGSEEALHNAAWIDTDCTNIFEEEAA